MGKLPETLTPYNLVYCCRSLPNTLYSRLPEIYAFRAQKSVPYEPSMRRIGRCSWCWYTHTHSHVRLYEYVSIREREREREIERESENERANKGAAFVCSVW